MAEFKTLQVLDRFRGWFEKAGVDYPVMRRIIQVKLTMDARRMPTIIGNRSKKKGNVGTQNEGNQFLSSLWMYVIFGGLSTMFIFMGGSYIFQMSLMFGIFMFMITTSLISDFSSVLLDIRDRHILSTKPINGKTIAMAKTVHIFIYMLFLTGSLAVVPLAVGTFRHGVVFFLLCVVNLILMDLLIVVFTALMYLAVLRFFDGEKLKDIINYVQIGLTIGITVGYQLLGRLFNIVDMDIVFQPKWWQYFIAPIWFGASFETVLRGGVNPQFNVFTVLAVLVPVISFIIYIRLMPALERNLQKLAEPDGNSGQRTGKGIKRIANILCSSPQENTFFRFAWTMMGNEREFKLKVYPSLGFSIIFPIIFLFSDGFQDGIQGLAGTNKYLFIYFCGLMLPTAIRLLRHSGKHKAAWIYQTMPIQNMSDVYKGTLLACLVRMVLPLFIVESIIFILLFGPSIIPDLVVVGLVLQLYAIISFGYFKKGLPFSEPFEAVQQSEGLRIIPIMLLLGVFALLHLLATCFPFGVLVYAAMLIAAIWLAWRLTFASKRVNSDN